MSWLFIDTHVPGQYRLGLCATHGRQQIRLYKGRTRSALTRLHRLWKTHASDIEGILVVAGPGSFSAIRTGVLYANLLATCLRLPLQSVSVSEAEDVRTLALALAARQGTPSLSYVAPVYDAEPNITLPRTA